MYVSFHSSCFPGNWLWSSQYDTNSHKARFTGILRGQESFAQAVSFGINTRDWYRGRVPMVVNTILLGTVSIHLPTPPNLFSSDLPSAFPLTISTLIIHSVHSPLDPFPYPNTFLH